MKCLKILGLAAVAAVVLTAVAGANSASATVLCKVKPTKTEKGETCPVAQVWGKGTPIGGKPPAGKKEMMKNTAGETLVECGASTIEGETENEGSETQTVHGPIATLDFAECNHTVDTLVAGELEIADISSEEGNGTVTAKSSEVTASILGVSCSYGAGAGIDIGTLVGGEPATMSINTILSKTSGSFLCPSDVRWEASYSLAKPVKLWTADYAD